MKVGALIFLGVTGLIAQPARAQAPAGAAKSTTVSADSLLADGYEVKTVTPVSEAAQKEIWPNQTLGTQVMVTLQKGTSVAVCAMATVSWATLPDGSMTNAGLCVKR